MDQNRQPKGIPSGGQFSEQAKAESDISLSVPARPRRLSATETAKAIRPVLKNKFPGTRFSVRTDKYAGGASIDISWTDGPTDAEVTEYTKPFSGAGFDGMVDMKYGKDAWLASDGTATLAGTEGTASSAGSVPAAYRSAPDPDAELVSFGADYVFTRRKLSDEFLADAEARFDGSPLTVTRAEQCRECGNWMQPGHPTAAVARARDGWLDSVCSPRCGGTREAKFGHIRPRGD